MNVQKTKLRQRLKRQRMELAPRQIAKMSETIAARLREVTDWSRVKKLHCYIPITSLNEVNVTPFVEFLQKEHTAIEVYTSLKQAGEWRIINIQSGESGENEKFHAIIVPMLGFDDSLNRIGYGGGYYDRLLAAQPQAQKIGVCFELGKVTELPIEPPDILLDMIVTEHHIYQRQKE